MNNPIKPFEFNTHQLRVIVDEHGEPWFIAKDICEILGYSNHARTINDLCRKTGIRITYIPALSANYTLINEGNLYRLSIKSNKPESEPFEAMVCDEILPAIRKTGSYSINPNSSVTPPPDIQARLNQLEVLQRYTLRNNKPWRKIAHYQPMGLNSYEIAKLTGLGETTVRTYTAQMQACGLLPKAQQLDLFSEV